MGMSGVSGTSGITGYAPPGTRPGGAMHPPITTIDSRNVIVDIIDTGIVNDMINLDRISGNNNTSEDTLNEEDDELYDEVDDGSVEDVTPPNNGRVYPRTILNDSLYSHDSSGIMGTSGTTTMSYEDYINHTLMIVTSAFNDNFARRPINQVREEDVREYLTPMLLSCFRSEENFTISFNAGRLIITIRPPAYASIIQLDTGISNDWNITKKREDVIEF